VPLAVTADTQRLQPPAPAVWVRRADSGEK